MKWSDECFELFRSSSACFIVIRCKYDSIDILIQDRSGKIIYAERLIHDITAVACEHIEVYLLTRLLLGRDIRQPVDIGFRQDQLRGLWIHFDEESGKLVSTTDISPEARIGRTYEGGIYLSFVVLTCEDAVSFRIQIDLTVIDESLDEVTVDLSLVT